MSLEQMFTTVVGVAPSLPRQGYLEALLTKIGEMPDEDWRRLSKEAQIWANNAMESFNQRTTIPDYAPPPPEEEVIPRTPRAARRAPEPAEEPAAPRTAANGGAAQAEAPAPAAPAPTRRRRAAAAPAPEPAPTRVARTAPDGDGRRPGAQVLIKRMVMDNPSVTYEELERELSRQGYSTSKLTINTVSADFRASLRLLTEKGLLIPAFASRVSPHARQRAA